MFDVKAGLKPGGWHLAKSPKVCRSPVQMISSGYKKTVHRKPQALALATVKKRAILADGRADTDTGSSAKSNRCPDSRLLAVFVVLLFRAPSNLCYTLDTSTNFQRWTCRETSNPRAGSGGGDWPGYEIEWRLSNSRLSL